MATNKKRKRRFYKQIFFLLALIVLAAGSFYLYAEKYNAENLVCGQFVGENASGSAQRLCFELAETESKRAKGLMFRKPDQLGTNDGMIFIYPEEGMRSFWMKNTYTALDMIFMNSEMQVVGLVENAVPFTETPRRISKPSQYIVELHAGSAKRLGIAEGARLTLERELPRGR